RIGKGHAKRPALGVILLARGPRYHMTGPGPRVRSDSPARGLARIRTMSDPMPPERPGIEAHQRTRSGLRVRTLILLVMGCGVILGAWRFVDQNQDVERSLASLRIRDLDDADPTVRLAAVESLGQVRGRDFRRVFPALVAAVGDRDPRVRLAAARSLAPSI